MKLIILNGNDPYQNLAIEEYLFLNSDDDVFMLWQNEKTVVIGKNQNAYAEVDMRYVEDNGIKIARRITGGGAVYHDLGNINYTFISVKDKHRSMDFEYFTEPIREALLSLGINAVLSGRNDLLVDGKKISGNAQYSANDRVLHHGTLLFDSDAEVISTVLRVDAEKISAKAIKSVRSRVGNISDHLKSNITAKEFMSLISEYVAKAFCAIPQTPPNNDEIDALTKRNSSDEWIYPDKDFLSKYTKNKKKRFVSGIVELHLNMHNDKILDARITGDFFGNLDISLLEKMLISKRISDVPSLLCEIEIGEFIYGINNADFLSLL